MSDRKSTRNASRPAPRARLSDDQMKQVLDDLENQILDRISIEAAYAAMGVRYTGSRSGDRLFCYAIDRDKESTPGSASVMIGGTYRGFYGDFAHGQINLSLFNFAWKYGPYRDYMAALRHFAGVAGVAWPFGEGRESAPTPKSVVMPSSGRRGKKVIREDIGPNLLAFHERAVRLGKIDQWAAELGVHRDGLVAQRVGYPGPDAPDEYRLDDSGENALYPECQMLDPDRPEVRLDKPVMMSADRRGAGKIKKAINDRPRGISPALGWLPTARASGYLFVCEGGSDVAALTSMGLAAIGVPSAGVGGLHLAELVGLAADGDRLPTDTRIILTIDLDGGAGITGMRKIGRILANRLRRPVHLRYAPPLPDLFRFDLKDAREWLNLACPRADLAPQDVRHELGRRFAHEAFERGKADVDKVVHEDLPEVPPVEGVATGKTSIGALQVFSNIQENLREGSEPVEIPNRLGARQNAKISTQPVSKSPLTAESLALDFAPQPPDPLASLPRLRPCLVNADREFVMRHRENRFMGIGLQLRCRSWGCEGCRTWQVRRWSAHLANIFNDPPHALWPAPPCFWRGRESGCDRITNFVTRHKGQWVRIAEPGGKALIIATIPFPRGKRLTFEPVAEMVRAICAITPPPDDIDRYVPISRSTGWRLPEPAKTGEFARVGVANARQAAHDAWRDMGVSVEEEKPKRDPAKTNRCYPAHWTVIHQDWADIWAMCGSLWPGFKPGDLPIDPQPYWEALRDALVPERDWEDMSDVD